MFDYVSVPLEEEYVSEHKACSTPPGIPHLAEAMIECALADIRYDRKHGRAVAKSKGIYRGRLKGTTKAKPTRAKELHNRGLTVPEIANALGVSRRTVFRYMAGG